MQIAPTGNALGRKVRQRRTSICPLGCGAPMGAFFFATSSDMADFRGQGPSLTWPPLSSSTRMAIFHGTSAVASLRTAERSRLTISAVDGQGNVVLVGTAGGTFDCGTGARSTLFGYKNVVVVKYSSAGIVQWVKKFGGVSADSEGHGVAVDSSGDVFVVGAFHGSINFSPNAMFEMEDVAAEERDSWPS